ncbi:MAG: hypothetical protein FJ008_05385 [Chloroflexi bacterium]|nr:hypothetical protein [Chloroflexota bacterium]MBM3173527.1 hypothetical protein [Chloroflexota bacterium]MBM3175635.1 hypothetical protein [Chloroflexota bacterium]MBM4450239.1 hypothetical protein [Chloroflexota bacterium]
MMKQSNRLSAEERDGIVEVLINKYKADPSTMENVLPEIAQRLRELVPADSKSGSVNPFTLTETEEKQRLSSYQSIISRVDNLEAPISKDQAVKALEDAAAILEVASYVKVIEPGDILKLLKIIKGSPVSKRGKVRQIVVSKGEPARSIALLRGVQAHLTWDKKLLNIEVDPKRLAERDAALKLVGVARDSDKDVAHRHDYYLSKENTCAY